MTYSTDLRRRVTKFVKEGGKQADAVRLFGVDRKTIYNWLHHKTSTQRPKTRQRKLVKADLLALVQHQNDARLIDYANQLGVTPQAVWYAFRRWGITKKNHPIHRTKVYTTD